MNALCLIVLLWTSGVHVILGQFEPLPEKEWWQHATIYQIYPRSFQDSNGDGIGDLNGITSRLSHLQNIGVDTIWLSPIFKSPQVDLGYDVSDFFAIEDDYGTMQNFEDMIVEIKRLGLRILLDFVPNHSSDQHQWFIDSVAEVSGFENYYVWHEGKMVEGVREPPNNWISVFGNSAWTWNEQRQKYYLHQFTPGQPDLNYREPRVLEAMDNVLKFWLDKGVDGFRFDAINHLFEDTLFRDEPVSGWGEPNTYDYLDHIYTKDVEGVYGVINRWRNILEKYKADNDGDTRIIMTEAYTNITFTMRYYQSDDGTEQRAHMPFNFELIYVGGYELTAARVMGGINQWLDNMPEGHTPNWVLGSHDHSRSATKFGSRKIDLVNTLLMVLPGCSITYYGEEIGMHDHTGFEISDSRDPNRTPMQWDDEPGAGFSGTTNTWLPVHPNSKGHNVYLENGKIFSHMEYFKSLTNLRQQTTMIHGTFRARILLDDILVIIRELPGYDTFVTVLNFGDKYRKVDISLLEELSGESRAEVVTIQSEYKFGKPVPLNEIKICSYDAIVLRIFAAPWAGASIATTSIAIMIFAVLFHFLL